MPPPRRSSSLDDTAAALLAQRGLRLVSCTPVQSLWAGYGHICAVEATGPGAAGADAVPVSLVLKSIVAPPAARADEGHRRKMLSYQVERHFYAHLAPRLPARAAVARCLASSSSGGGGGGSDGRGASSALLLRDLRVPWPRDLRLLPRADDDDDGDGDGDEAHAADAAFPLALEKRGVLSAPLVTAALDWLAGFHGHFWGRRDGDGRRRPVLDDDRASLVRPPLQQRGDDDVRNIWLNGGYTYLATRRHEYASLVAAAAGRGGHDDDEWGAALCAPGRSGRAIAEEVAEFLTPAADGGGGGGAVAEYETVIHGDVKSENMFGTTTTDWPPSSSSPSPSNSAATAAVAFFDFQYVGLGLGVCDLAKLFTCSVPLAQLLGGDAGAAADDDDVPRELDMQAGERALLQHYVRTLESVAGKRYPWDVFARHWEAALVDWIRFQKSWGCWGNTAWLEARVRFILKRRPSPWP